MLMKSVLALFIIITLLTSCKQKEDAETNINNYTNAVLVASQGTTSAAIRTRIDRLKEKLNKVETKDSAIVYKPKADSAIALGNYVINYLDALLDKVKDKDKLEEKDSLFEKLKSYEANIVKIDARTTDEFFDITILRLDTLLGFRNMNREQFNRQFLDNLSKKQWIAFLNSLKEDILIIEAEMVEYLDRQCSYMSEGEAYDCIVSQNSERFKPNHILELTAGIGKFEFHPDAKFIVGNKEIPIKDSIAGVAVYKMKVPKETGKHKLRVKISWTKPNGNPIELEKYVVYYVE